VVDFVRQWAEKTEIATIAIVGMLGIGAAKFYSWRQRYGKVNEHNARVPRDHWLQESEKQAIVQFHHAHPGEGYRRLTYMMIDANVVFASPSTVWRVLGGAGLLQRFPRHPSKKGTGFVQPLAAHEHWHVDISYINIQGTFYYLCAVIDGASRFIVAWHLRASMTEVEVEIVIQQGRDAFPGVRPRIISDNGPQFIAKDFKEFIRSTGMTHVRTSPYYPQSNGKIERWNKSYKEECVRPGTPLSHEDGLRITARYIEHYNNVRLHSSLGYVTPKAWLEGRQQAILDERDRKLEEARLARQNMRRQGVPYSPPGPSGLGDPPAGQIVTNVLQ
jgi:putative transposase